GPRSLENVIFPPWTATLPPPHLVELAHNGRVRLSNLNLPTWDYLVRRDGYFGLRNYRDLKDKLEEFTPAGGSARQVRVSHRRGRYEAASDSPGDAKSLHHVVDDAQRTERT